MQQLLRDITNLTKKTSGIIVNFIKWSLDSIKVSDSAQVLFIDGVISINKNSKTFITQIQAENYAMLVDNQAELIEKYSLVDGDVFLGRDDNYMLFRDGNLSLKTKSLNLNVDDISLSLTGTITINGIELSFVDDKFLIGGKEIAVVGGATSDGASINSSGQ